MGLRLSPNVTGSNQNNSGDITGALNLVEEVTEDRETSEIITHIERSRALMA